MDPNPKKFPILSYVLSRLHPKPNPNSRPSPSSAVDIEQPLPLYSPRHGELVERMPRLTNPALLSSMSQAIADVAQTRSVLSTLGDRPDHEAVDAARARVVEIDAELSIGLEDLMREPRPEGVDVAEWRGQVAERERELRARAEREKCAFRAVVQLDEMHEAYENLLRDAEERLLRIYGSEGGEGAGKEGNSSQAGGEEEEEGVVQMNEEVARILQEDASGKVVERVDLSSRQLRLLPEAFGRLRGLLVLNLSDNQLEAIPDAIAGLELLKELRLSSNLLVQLPDSIGLLLNLKILDVSGNKLKALPDSISHCRSLVELDASYNELTYLPTNIGFELVNLQKLMIHLNKVRWLPTSICEMMSLRHMDAHFNEIHGLPSAFGKLINLEILDLSSNFSDLTELPDSFGDLRSLRELDLSNNQIQALPDTFGRLENLAKLNLDQNPIVIPPMEVVEKGVYAIKDFMSKRLLEILLEEERKHELEVNVESQTGWLSRSTSLLTRGTSLLTGWVSGGASGYLGSGSKSFKDPYLDQEL